MAAADILRLSNSATPTQRFTLAANGRVFGAWTAVELERDLGYISAGATLEFYDPMRAQRAFGSAAYTPQQWQPLVCGTRATLSLDGEPVLRGWVEEVKSRLTGEEMAVSVSLLDDAAHLEECAAAPTGPAEYRNLTVTQFAQRICAPFGLEVRADVDVGAAFPLIGLDLAETALAAIEKLARQRSLLVTSDGLGKLVLTRGGAAQAPAPLRLGELLQEISWTDSWRGRHSDYYVKGQSTPNRAERMDGTANPMSTTAPAPAPAARAERPAVVMTGHATDPEVTLYRPQVRQSKTQSGGATVQEQAEWMARVARGRGEVHVLTLNDYRAGDARELWRPNTVALVDDPWNNVLEERLIGAVTYRYSEDGSSCLLKVLRPGAFDLDPAVRQKQRSRSTGQALDGTARGMTR